MLDRYLPQDVVIRYSTAWIVVFLFTQPHKRECCRDLLDEPTWIAFVNKSLLSPSNITGFYISCKLSGFIAKQLWMFPKVDPFENTSQRPFLSIVICICHFSILLKNLCRGSRRMIMLYFITELPKPCSSPGRIPLKESSIELTQMCVCFLLGLEGLPSFSLQAR